MSETKTYAVIDIGSNSMRLIIYRHDQHGKWSQLVNRKVATRLRSYLENDGVLQQEGTNQLVQTLKEFQTITRHYQLDDVLCTATAALRNADNRRSILELVNEQTDFSIQLLSAYEEAYYGFLAVVNSMPYSKGITIDVGGGSTEVTYFEDRKLIHYHSFPFGALSLKQYFIQEEKMSNEAFRAMNTYVHTQMGSLQWLKNCQVPIIGIGGNAHNIVRVHQKRNGNQKNYINVQSLLMTFTTYPLFYNHYILRS